MRARSLSDIDRSTAANDLQPSASFSALKNPQRIPVNTPPVFPSLRPCIWLYLLRLATKAMSDRLLTSFYWKLFHDFFGKERGLEHPTHAGLHCPVQTQK